MSDVIRVDPQALHLSARLTDGHAEDVHIGHASADARIESSLYAWVGASMAAMSAKAAQWQAATAAFSARLVHHAEGLRGSAVEFQRTEDHNAVDIGAVGTAANQADAESL